MSAERRAELAELYPWLDLDEPVPMVVCRICLATVGRDECEAFYLPERVTAHIEAEH